jgi:hypothetical protein
VNNSTISGNSAAEGGAGIYNGGTLSVTNSTIYGNFASAKGGGIYNDGATLSVINSTISGNSADYGGGIDNENATVTVNNSTISGNGALIGGGIYNLTGTLEIGNTVLNASIHFNVYGGAVISLGYNLSSDGTGPNNGTTDRINTNPMLGSLQDNGGPTFTHALMTGSPAIDKGKNLSGSTTDQRGTGFARSYDDPAITNATGGDGTDIGAFEVQEVQPRYSAQVQQPINVDGSSVFSVRRGVVPVKFTLTLDGVATCDLPLATIAVTRTAGAATGQIDESVYTGSADTGSNFRIDSCQYIYNLSASALGVGTYQVDIIINGQVVGSATFKLR